MSGIPTNSIGLIINTLNPLAINLGGTGNTSGTATPSGSAGGDLSGTYPNPSVAKINTVTVASSTVSDGQLLIGSTSGSNYSAATLTGTTNQVNVANSSNAITLSLPQPIDNSASPRFTGLNLSGLSASEAVVTDGSFNLTSLAYNAANFPSTLVARDSSGNFSAGTITANLTGNSASATTATNANNIATLSASTNANFPLIFVASSTNSNQAPELNSNLNYNPATGLLNINSGGGINSSLNIGSSAASLLGTTKALTFSNSLSAGNYINFGTNGRNIGVFQGGNTFYTMGLDYNVTGTNYLYANGGSATGVALELTTGGGFNFNTAPSGSNGAAATVTTRLSISNTGIVNVPNITASSLVVTDPSNNLSATNTLSSTVLGNIPKATTTSLTSGSGTYTPPANCTRIRVRCWGGGGGGGGAAGTTANAAAAGGGAGGGYCETIITSPSGGGYSYAVGALGAGGVAGNNSGTAGGATTFGTLSAGGGGPGAGSAAGLGPTIGLGTTGGSSSGGLVNCGGGAGGNGVILSGTVSIGGYGGAASCGGGMVRGRSGANTGLSGNFPGGGGSGATSTTSANTAGGDGALGLIIVEEYYNG